MNDVNADGTNNKSRDHAQQQNGDVSRLIDTLKMVGADLGFYKGGCPIHLKGAPEVERRTRPGGAPSPHFFISYIKTASFYAFLEIFNDTVTALTTCFEHIFFKKGTLIKRAGRRCLDALNNPWIPHCKWCYKTRLSGGKN